MTCVRKDTYKQTKNANIKPPLSHDVSERHWGAHGCERRRRAANWGKETVAKERGTVLSAVAAGEVPPSLGPTTIKLSLLGARGVCASSPLY